MADTRNWIDSNVLLVPSVAFKPKSKIDRTPAAGIRTERWVSGFGSIDKIDEFRGLYVVVVESDDVDNRVARVGDVLQAVLFKHSLFAMISSGQMVQPDVSDRSTSKLQDGYQNLRSR